MRSQVKELPSEFLQKVWDQPIRLRQGVVLQQNEDGHFLVADAESDRFFYCNKKAYLYLMALNTGTSIAEYSAERRLSLENCLELEPLLLKLINFQMLDGLSPVKVPFSFKSIIIQPFAIKIPLFNPSKLLQSLKWLGKFLFSSSFFVLFSLLLCWVSIQVFTHWGEIQFHWESRFFEASNWGLMALAYIVLKALHEMAHGLAVTHYGGRVRECGLFFIVFMPLPYVNTSASYLFPKRSQRVLVGCAGMQLEFTLAMLAIIGWLNLETGLAKDFLFSVAFVGSFSTLIFNLNPLMKFDGYYILSDLTGVINLNERSKQILGSKVKKILFGIVSNASKDHFNTKSWMPLYAGLAIPYRFFIAITIAVYLLSEFFAFGAILAIWILLSMLVIPVVLGGINLLETAKKQGRSLRLITVTSGFLGTAYILSAMALFNFSSSHRALATIPPHSQIRVNAEGVIKQIKLADRDYVDGSQLLMEIENRALMTELEREKASLLEFQASLRKVRLQDLVMTASWQEKIEVQKNKVKELEQQVLALEVYLPREGHLILEPGVLSGAYLSRGDLAGYVYSPGAINLIALVQQHQIQRIKSEFSDAEVVFDSNPERAYIAKLLSIKPVGKRYLPSSFLGSAKGGDIIVDGTDKQQTKALEPFFELEFEVQVDDLKYNPARGVVRINYQEMSLFNFYFADIRKEILQNLQ